MTGEIREIQLDDKAPFEMFRVRAGIDDAYHDQQRHRFYQMIWVEDGGGGHEVDFTRYPLSANRIYVIAPGQVHQWHDNDFRGRVILFNETLLGAGARERLLFGSGLFNAPVAAPFVDIGPETPADLATLIDLIEREYRSETTDWDLVRPLLTAFIHLLIRIAKSGSPLAGHRQSERIARLLTLIDEHHIVERSPEFYAEQLKLSAKRINQIARQFLGRTIVQLVHDRLVLEARRDLSLSARDVKSIGHRLGFDDASYFSRFFRRETGYTPNEFRQAMQTTTQASFVFDEAG